MWFIFSETSKFDIFDYQRWKLCIRHFKLGRTGRKLGDVRAALLLHQWCISGYLF